MKLYTDSKGRWAGTQSDAKHFGKSYVDYETVDVPTDKPNLLAFLNKHSVGGDGFRVDALVDDDWEMPAAKTHPQSCSANDLSAYDVRDVVLNCDKKHLGSALGSIVSRLYDMQEYV